VHWDGGSHEADLVAVAIGVRPATDFLRGTGLPLTEDGALRPDPHGRVADHVWAAGDCCEVRRRIDDAWVFRPLGTHANKHGRALGDSLAGGSLAFEGMTDTSITRFAACGQYVEIARTGPARTRRRPASTRSRSSPRARRRAATCRRPTRSPSG
jgi:NADPH-dependent 2,4-dienoyl-CoA reductase/sulfur reductase-like enzyme